MLWSERHRWSAIGESRDGMRIEATVSGEVRDAAVWCARVTDVDHWSLQGNESARVNAKRRKEDFALSLVRLRVGP